MNATLFTRLLPQQTGIDLVHEFPATGSLAMLQDQVSASYGAAVADLDRDGDLDLIVTNLGEPISVYRNDSPSGHRLITCRH